MHRWCPSTGNSVRHEQPLQKTQTKTSLHTCHNDKSKNWQHRTLVRCGETAALARCWWDIQGCGTLGSRPQRLRTQCPDTRCYLPDLGLNDLPAARCPCPVKGKVSWSVRKRHRQMRLLCSLPQLAQQILPPSFTQPRPH